VKVTIEFTTDSYDYQVLKNDKFFEENYKDNDVVMDLVERLHNSTTYGEREEIAEELWEECGYDNAARMLGDGKLEVTYKQGDEEDIDESSYEILDSDWVDFNDFFEDDIKKSSFCIIRNSYSKRAHYYLKTELDEPFSGEFLKIADGGISYKDEELEFTGDAGGWIEESGIYVMGSNEIESEEQKRKEEVDIGKFRDKKIEELFAAELNSYQKRRDEIDQTRDTDRFFLWKQCGIPDNGESSWDELDEMDDDLNYPYDLYLEKLDDDDPRKKQWESGWDKISEKIWKMNEENPYPLNMDSLNHYRHTTDIDYINSWDESTKQKILCMQKNLDDLDEWLEKEKIEQFRLCGYSMHESDYDSEKDVDIVRPCSKWNDVDVEESIKKYMESIGEDDYESEYTTNPKTGNYEEVKGEDYDKLISLWSEWRKKEEGIDDEYKKKRNGIIHNDDNY
tara:strand:+ start:4539 stop:5891 length:1353 start_codon:yes stop_codon:yes gene_type:complete